MNQKSKKKGKDKAVYTVTMERIAKVLQEYRDGGGNMRALAKEAGVSAGFLSQLVRGVGPSPQLSKIAAVFEILGRSIVDIPKD